MGKKIIHFTIRSTKGNFYSKDDPNFYFGGWATIQAEGLTKYDSAVKQEIWRPDFEMHETKSREIKGIKCRLFPLRGFFRKYHLNPLSLLKELKRECKKNKVIINLHYIHDLASIIIIFLFKKYPIVIHHHGSPPFRYRANKKGIKKILNRLFMRIDEHLLKNIDYFSVISANEKEYLEHYTGAKNVVLEQGRKYYAEYKPIDKIEARIKLGLPVDKKIIMYVGHFYRVKGVDALLETYKKLEKKYNIMLLMIGGNNNNELYDEVKKSGAMHLGNILNNEMVFYYSASDVYVLYSDNETLVKFGGLGTAPIEAMACNTPIVSSQLIHFHEDANDDWKKVGELPKNREDLYYCIEKVFDNPENYTPRKTSIKYYDFEKILKKNLVVYKGLIEKYYE